MSAASIFTIFFFLGLSSTMAQTIMIREALVVFFGNELIIGSILGAWLLAISLGALLGSGPASRSRRPLPLFLAAVAAGLAALPLQVLALRLGRLILDVPPGQYVPFAPAILTAVLCLAPYALMIGFTFPLGCRLAAEVWGREPESIGSVYVIEAAGAMVGGPVFTFFLLSHLNAFQIPALLLGVFIILLPIIAWRRRSRLVRLLAVLAAVPVAVGLLYLYDLFDSYSESRRWRSLAGEIELVRSVDSKYQNLALSHFPGQYGVHGDGLFFFPIPDPYGYAMLAGYVLAQHPGPDSVLVVGNATGGLLSAMLESSVRRIDAVQLDPDIDRLIYPVLPDRDRRAIANPRSNVVYSDGRFYLRTTRARYDLVFLNLPDPSSAVINRYYTAEFFQQVKKALRPGGVLALRLTAAENYLTEEIANYSASVFHTLNSVFPHVLVTSGETYFMFASDSAGAVTADTEALAERHRRFGGRSEYFSPRLFEMILPPERLEFIRRALTAKEDVRLNHDLRPVTYFFNLLLWDRYASGLRRPRAPIGPLFRKLSGVSPLWLFSGFLLLLLLRLGYLAAKKPARSLQGRFNSTLAVAVCGFTAMGLEIVLLYGFQIIFGSLYRMVALVVAAFMLGLALGSWTLTRNLYRIMNPARAFIGLHLLVALFALSLPTLLGSFAAGTPASLGEVPAQAAFLILLVIPGFLTGAGFPLAGRIYLEAGGGVGRAAGMIDWSDHLGAFFGAFLTGTLLIPVFGADTAGGLVAGLNLACIVLWLYILRTKG